MPKDIPSAHATHKSSPYQRSPIKQTAANSNLKTPSQTGTSISSNGEMNFVNNTFYHVHGDVQHNPPLRSGIIQVASMQESALENMPGSVKGTIRIPRFSRSLLLRDWSVDTSEPSAARLEGSCSYDLASSLRLLPGQENEEFAEYDEDISVDRAISRDQCYCGRISRHGLIFLITRHLQSITTAETASGGLSLIAQTTLGRFRFYEQNDKSFVHFDRTTRLSTVDLIPNQKLENILKASSGQYCMSEILLEVDSDTMNFVWHRCSCDLLEDMATEHCFGIPDVVMYMNKHVLEDWKRLKQFSNAMLEAMMSVLNELEEPSSFIEALGNMPRSSANYDQLDMGNAPAKRLAACVWLCKALYEKKIEYIDVATLRIFLLLTLGDLIKAHQHFRSPRAEASSLFTTSRDRFKRIFRRYSMADNTNSTRPSGDTLREELLALLCSNRNNVALVVYQGFFATLARLNSARVLLRAREVPQEWIRFMAADDNYIYIG